MTLALLVGLTTSAGAFAQEHSGDASAATQMDIYESIDSARTATRSAAVRLASGIDSWFGDKPFDAGGQVKDGEISMKFYSRQHQKTDYSLTFNARFSLPNLEEHTYLFTGRDSVDGVVADRPNVFAAKQRLLQPNAAADQTFFAGFGLGVSDSLDARIGLQGGLKLFAQGRYRKEWLPTADDQVEFRQTVYLTQADGLGSSTVLSYQHQFFPTVVGRWLNEISMTESNPDVVWNGSFGVFKLMGEQRLLSVEVLLSAKQNAAPGLADYGLQMRWEQPVLRNKLMGEVVLGHFWPQSENGMGRSTAWAVGTGIKMKF